MTHKFHHYWRKSSEKEARLCFMAGEEIGDSIFDESDEIEGLLDEEIPENVSTLHEFLGENKDETWKKSHSLGKIVAYLLGKKTSYSDEKRLALLKKVVSSVADDSEDAKIEDELNEATLDTFRKHATAVNITVTPEAVKNAEVAREERSEPPQPEVAEETKAKSAIDRSIEKIPKDGAWHGATLPKEKLLGLKYCIVKSGTIYRCDTSGKWSETWANGKWEFSTEYKEGGRALWLEHKDYMDGKTMRKQQSTFTGVRRYGSELMKNSDGSKSYNKATGRPNRKYYIKMNQPYANYISDPTEKEKYLAIPRDSMWHNYDDLDFREGYQKDPAMKHWQYRLHSDGFMYARRPIRTNGRLSWKIAVYAWNADGSAQWFDAPASKANEVINSTFDGSPSPIKDRWAQFDRKKMKKQGYYMN